MSDRMVPKRACRGGPWSAFAGRKLRPHKSIFARRGAVFGWLVIALAMPKCLLCLAGYLALAAGIATAAPELCGGEADAGFGAVGWWLAGPLVFAGVAFFRGRRVRVSGSERVVR